MSKTIVITLSPHAGIRRFEMVKVASTGDKQTVVRVRNGITTRLTLKKVKWSRYKAINWLIRVWIIIRYAI